MLTDLISDPGQDLHTHTDSQQDLPTADVPTPHNDAWLQMIGTNVESLLSDVMSDIRKDRPAGDVHDDGWQPMIVTDSMESMSANAISDADMHTHSDSRQDRPIADVPPHDDGWQLVNSFIESMPSNAISDAVADRRDMPTHAGSQQGPSASDGQDSLQCQQRLPSTPAWNL